MTYPTLPQIGWYSLPSLFRIEVRLVEFYACRRLTSQSEAELAGRLLGSVRVGFGWRRHDVAYVEYWQGERAVGWIQK